MSDANVLRTVEVGQIWSVAARRGLGRFTGRLVRIEDLRGRPYAFLQHLKDTQRVEWVSVEALRRGWRGSRLEACNAAEG